MSVEIGEMMLDTSENSVTGTTTISKRVACAVMATLSKRARANERARNYLIFLMLILLALFASTLFAFPTPEMFWPRNGASPVPTSQIISWHPLERAELYDVLTVEQSAAGCTPSVFHTSIRACLVQPVTGQDLLNTLRQPLV